MSVPDGGAYRVDLEAVDDDDELIAMAHGHVDQAPGQADTTPPWLEWGEIDGDTMRLYFSEPLNENVVGGRIHPYVQYDRFCLCQAGGFVQPAMEISGNMVSVNFNGFVTAVEGLRASVAYWVFPGDTSLQDLAGNKVWTSDVSYNGARSTRIVSLRNVTGRPKIGRSGVAISSDPGADGSYASGDAIKVKVNFSESVDVTGTPRLKIDLDPADGGERWADYSAGSGTMILEFTYTVVEGNSASQGVAVPTNTLELNGGTIRAAWATVVEDARLSHSGLGHDPRHRVLTPDSPAPVLQSAGVTGTALTLTFSETLGAAASLSNGAFTVKKTPQDGTEREVSLSGTPAISGDTVTLTLSSAALNTDTGVKVSYAKPTTGTNNKLVDAGGSEVADFTDEPVKNAPDTTQPTLVRGKIDGDVITLYFNEPLDEHTGGKGDYYRVRLQYLSLYGGAPHHGRCRSGNGGWSSSVLKPREVQISGSTVTVVGLTEDARFRAGVGQNYNGVEYIADVTTPADQRLRDVWGNHVITADDFFSTDRYRFAEYIDLENVTRLPYPKSATVNGTRLTLTFNAPMDGDSKPAAGTFTVKVNGSAVNLAVANPVTMSGNTFTLTLATAVASGDTVTVSYAKPSARPLQNVICEDAPSFTDVPVTNTTS